MTKKKMYPYPEFPVGKEISDPPEMSFPRKSWLVGELPSKPHMHERGTEFHGKIKIKKVPFVTKKIQQIKNEVKVRILSENI